MNEAATKSTPFSQPNFKSAISFSANAGNPTETPGRLTPLISPNSPVFFISQNISLSFISSTSSPINPSSKRIVFPGFKSLTIPGYETDILSLFPT